MDIFHLFMSGSITNKAVVEPEERFMENSNLGAACFTSPQSSPLCAVLDKLVLSTI